jgi:hypothetical protein
LLLAQAVQAPLHMLLLVQTVQIREFGHRHHFLLFGHRVEALVVQEDLLDHLLDPLTLMVVLGVLEVAAVVMQVVLEA